MSEPIAVARHVSRDHVTITPRYGYSVVVFNFSTFGGAPIEAIIAAADGSETVRLLVAGPGSAQTISIETETRCNQPDITHIYYREAS
jgi:hypothetical protein